MSSPLLQFHYLDKRFSTAITGIFYATYSYYNLMLFLIRKNEEAHLQHGVKALEVEKAQIELNNTIIEYVTKQPSNTTLPTVEPYNWIPILIIAGCVTFGALLLYMFFKGGGGGGGDSNFPSNDPSSTRTIQNNTIEILKKTDDLFIKQQVIIENQLLECAEKALDEASKSG